MDARKNIIGMCVAELSDRDIAEAYKNIVDWKESGVLPEGPCKLKEVEKSIREAIGWTGINYRAAEDAVLMEAGRRFFNRGTWIPVEEYPPEEETEVFVRERNPNTGEFGREIRYYDPKMYMPYWQYVTHWMPLPDEPDCIAVEKLDGSRHAAVEHLTLDELRQMDAEPVWVESLIKPGAGYWMLVYTDCVCNRMGVVFFEDYGKDWLAYRRKVEGVNHEKIDLA